MGWKYEYLVRRLPWKWDASAGRIHITWYGSHEWQPGNLGHSRLQTILAEVFMEIQTTISLVFVGMSAAALVVVIRMRKLPADSDTIRSLNFHLADALDRIGSRITSVTECLETVAERVNRLERTIVLPSPTEHFHNDGRRAYPPQGGSGTAPPQNNQPNQPTGTRLIITGDSNGPAR